MSEAKIRWMIRRDIPRVAEIEADCFEFPWDEESFCLALGQRNNIGIVLEIDETIYGYMIYQMCRGYFNLANIAIDPDYQRCGLGGVFIAYLKNKLHPDRRDVITTEVREKNLDAQLFFRATGFRATGILPGQYIDSPEDMYVMELGIQKQVDAVANRIAKYMQA